ncbi:DUF3558 domain-containing protein [Amycolatopsis viridis]|uniref:DUF3558 domain-containing protein n=1 Tax=Amycolatopsis viridis TaxID=185678 RepID=A0ABX0SYL3_9PSEU|nr:DUF3558 domain-containing protein [Amycolatopsis viridis]NIH82068.1 hypothetical protein [Amycolatopsis viridis]
MFRVARPRRFVLLVLLALTVSACGPDLAKQNFPRTTVTESSVAPAPVDDPAVRLDALRTVDPCQILQGDTVTGVGAPVAESLYPRGLDGCGIHVTDAGGKEARLSLTMGELIDSTSQQAGAVDGLPVVENDLDDPDTPENEGCIVSVLTDSVAGLGIAVQVTYVGGDACGAGLTVLREVVRKVHAGPPQQRRPANSAVSLDPCALADTAVVTEVLGRATAKPVGLHDCNWTGGTADGWLRISQTVKPSEDENGSRITLAGGITAYQKKETRSGSRCTIAWTHLETGDEGEVVKFEYDNYHDDAAGDDSCGKARRIVDTILPKLPRA